MIGYVLVCLALPKKKKGRFYPCLPYHTLINFFISFYNMVQMCKRTQRGTLKSPILVRDLQEDALNVILEVDVPNELSNQDHEIEEILPTSLNVIL